MVVKLGGCNGSGKTSVVRAVMAMFDFKPIHWHGNAGKVKQYEAMISKSNSLSAYFDYIVVLGDYRNVCGGMDTISDKNDRLAMVEHFCTFNKTNQRTLVVYEGLITGKTYGAMGELSEKCRLPWLYVFMDTPFEECVARVLKRRKTKGNNAPFDPERTMRPTFKSCLSVAKRAEEAGHPVLQLEHKLSPEKLAGRIIILSVAIEGQRRVKGVK
jgi:thymidylate kinase